MRTLHSGLALIRLFQTLDTRLLAIQVQQAVVDTTPEIITRSKAKQGASRPRTAVGWASPMECFAR